MDSKSESSRAPDPEILIVGGGVIGCAIARELAGRGRRVRLLERARPGAEASSAAAGILSPQSDGRVPGPLFDLALESRSLYADWVAEIEVETGLSVGYRRTGLLRCARDEEDARALDVFLWQRDRGLAVEVWEADRLARRLGGRLAPSIRRGLFFPDEAVVDPARLVEALARSARLRGVEIREGVAVRGLRIENGRCLGVETGAESLRAGTVIVAAGAWSSLDGRLPFQMPVEPVRGQMIELEMGPASPDTVLLTDAAYLVPRENGRVFVGATVEHEGFRKEVTAGGLQALLASASDFFPSVRSARFLRAWAGLRPGTPDGLPVLGACEVERLLFATGHFRSGILLAPVTARRIADLISGRGIGDLAPFSVSRFGGPAGVPAAAASRSEIFG